MVSFDEHAQTYRGSVERSIAFAKVDHSHVTARKVDHLLRLCTELVGPPREQQGLDVGCGIGLTDQLLVDRVGALNAIEGGQRPEQFGSGLGRDSGRGHIEG